MSAGGPRVGLVLGSGGLAGTAYNAGVLTALCDELGWDARDAEVIAGTSAGSTAAALLRGGFPPGDYLARMTGEALSPEGERLMRDIPPVAPVTRRLPRGLRPASGALLRNAVLRPGRVHAGALLAAALPAGATPSADIAASIAPLHGERWPERPLWICAVRLDTGARVVFGRDADAPPATVGEAVTASCAIPGYYEPPVIGGARFVDGGVRSLCNLDLMAGLGLDLVVVTAPMATSAWIDRGRDAGLRAAARGQLAREARAVRGGGTPVVILAPGAEARAAMRGASMDAARRPRIARTARATAFEGVDAGGRALLDRLRAA